VADCKKHGVDFDELCKLNGRTVGESGWDRINVGMHLHIPVGESRAQGRISDSTAIELYSQFFKGRYLDWEFAHCEWILFLDVDFDGVLEAIVGSIQGSAGGSYTSMYRIDQNDRKVKELEYDEGGEQGDMFGYIWNENIILLKDKRDGTKAFLIGGAVQDGSRCDSVMHGTAIAQYINGVVGARAIAEVSRNRIENSNSYDETFWFTGEKSEREYSEREYGEKIRMFLDRYETIPLRTGICQLNGDEFIIRIDGKEAFRIKGLTEANLRKGITACYRASSCCN